MGVGVLTGIDCLFPHAAGQSPTCWMPRASTVIRSPPVFPLSELVQLVWCRLQGLQLSKVLEFDVVAVGSTAVLE